MHTSEKAIQLDVAGTRYSSARMTTDILPTIYFKRNGYVRWLQYLMKTLPDDLPAYRVLTGPDNAAFCHRVSEAIALGYRLYGSPAVTFNGENVIVAQAVIWPSITT